MIKHFLSFVFVGSLILICAYWAAVIAILVGEFVFLFIVLCCAFVHDFIFGEKQ